MDDTTEKSQTTTQVTQLIKSVLQLGLTGINQLEGIQVSLKTIILRIILAVILVVGLVVSLWVMVMAGLFMYLLHLHLSHLVAGLILAVFNLSLLVIVLIWLNFSRKKMKFIAIFNIFMLLKSLFNLFKQRRNS